jgi:hypothetical protein
LEKTIPRTRAMSDKWHGGKGDKSRISDPGKFSRNMERIYEKKSWQFWAVWECLDIEDIDFDKSDLDYLQKISYSEFVSRLK